MHQPSTTPALRRLDWILDGLDGAAGWGADAADVLAPEFTTHVPVDRYVQRCRDRAQRYAPLRIVGIDVAEATARARICNRDGEIDVLSCTVESRPPHRITMTWVQGVVPAGLEPRLPMDFTGSELTAPTTRNTILTVLSGVPGAGKSTLADALGRELAIPVFAVDWLLGALTPFGGRHFDDHFGIGYEQLTTLAMRQLSLGQSAILDAPVEDPRVRDRWRSLAEHAGASFKVIVCICSDPTTHRARVEGRQRGIPGWHNAGDWANVQQRLRDFPAWPDDVLTVDAVRPLPANLRYALDFLSAAPPST